MAAQKVRVKKAASSDPYRRKECARTWFSLRHESRSLLHIQHQDTATQNRQAENTPLNGPHLPRSAIHWTSMWTNVASTLPPLSDAATAR